MATAVELGGAEFGDKRLTRRLVKLVEALTPAPAASFPDATQTDASLEATYRFLQNEEVTPQRILAPHVAATVSRAEQAGSVVVAHDTSEFSFAGEREGLGPLGDGGQGFFGHFALALRGDGSRQPLGILGLRTFVRQPSKRKHRHSERLRPEQRESYRWQQLVDDVEAAVCDRVRPIHVMDSEADAYELLTTLLQRQRRFVIRLKFDRTVADPREGVRLQHKLDGLEGRLVRRVQLSKRTRIRPPKGQRNVDRSYREATLAFSATRVTLLAPRGVYGGGVPLEVHVVHVREVDPSQGVEAVDWKLVTTERIDSTEDLERIVDAYRARWVIEEFFKALKTGCALEKRQLVSLAGLLNALAVFTPIAYELLLLRAVARDPDDKPASAFLRPTQLLVLQRHKDTRLASRASVREALFAIARLGGHITNNGQPGWQVLGRGYQKLLAFELGAALALEM